MHHGDVYTQHILLCAKYGMPIWKQTEVTSQTRKHAKKPVNLILRSKLNIILEPWMYVTKFLMVKHRCAKYVKPNLIILTLRSWVNIKSYRNVRDTLSFGDTPIRQIWYPYVKPNKRPMGHITHLRNQFKSINTFQQSYGYIITFIRSEKNPLSPSWQLNALYL